LRCGRIGRASGFDVHCFGVSLGNSRLDLFAGHGQPMFAQGKKSNSV
jgi:hypothetical protein